MLNHRRRRRLGRSTIVLGLSFIAIALSVVHAEAYSARLRWLPSTDSSVVGYRVWVRQAFRSYTGSIDVGRPPLAGDRTMSWVVSGLASGRTYYFGVSAYTSSMEGWLSREIAIGDTDPCVIDRCYTGTNCEIEVHADGVSCGAGSCDVCRQARCSTLQPVDLESNGRVVARSDGVRARFRGRFTQNGRVDPTSMGVVLRFADASGATLLETNVPAGAFKGNTTGTRFRLADPRGVNGVRRLSLWVGSERVRVSMLVDGYDYQPLIENPDLRWTMRFGSDQCAVDPDIVCHGSRCS